MKKLFPLVILAFAIVACNKKYSGTDNGYGSLKMSAITDRSVISIQSRAANLNTETYILTLQSAQSVVYDGVFPSGGIISDLPAGTYTGRLRSEATEFAVPTFDLPFYAATVDNIVITSGGTTSIQFVCKQANAGVKFVYDPSLAAAGYGNIVPVVAQSEYRLSYSDANRNATGFFLAGSATLMLLDGETPVPISGSQTEIPLTLAAKELWTITIKAVVPPDEGGRSTITVTVDTEIDERTMEIIIDPTATSTDPALIMFQENFELCTGPNYPIEGATFSSSGFNNSLTSEEALNRAGLTGWTFVSGYTCKNGLKMGVTSGNERNGIATTPELIAIGATPANVILTFLAANCEVSPIGLKIDVTGDGSVVSPAGGIITLPAGTSSGGVVSSASAMKRYTVIINGATQNTRIVFSPSSASGNNRYFLADIAVALEE